MTVSSAVMLGVGWWERNSAMLQTLSTLALLVVTGVYVFITARIANKAAEQAVASTRQAEAADALIEHEREAFQAQQIASALELEQMKEVQEAQALTARRAEAHAQSVLAESTKARLSAMTPVCTVLFVNSPMSQADHGSIGNVEMAVFDRIAVEILVRFRIQNDGLSPALATTMPVAVDDADLTEDPDWLSTARDEVVLPGMGREAVFRIVSLGGTFRRWGEERRRISFEFETRSPISGVSDHHIWTGTFPAVVDVPGSGGGMFDHNRNSGFTGSSVAYPSRSWPAGFDP